MKIFGIDISRHQDGIDLNRAKAEGVKYVIVKAGGADDGFYADRCYEENYRKAKAAGLPVGAYYLVRSSTVEGAIKEADHFASLLEGKQFELPVFADAENRKMFTAGREAVTDALDAFCSHLEDLGYFAGIYISLSDARSYTDNSRLKRYMHWIAQYYKECTFEGDYGMWQFGGSQNPIRSNRVAGMVCDQNYMLEDYPAEIKAAGLNGFGAAPAPAPIKRGDVVRIKDGTRDLNSGSRLASWVSKSDLYVKQVNGSRVVLTTHSDLSGTTAAVHIDSIIV